MTEPPKETTVPDRTPAPVPPCPRCEVDPHSEPAVPHVHFTDYGYVLYTPNHELRDYIEEIRASERAAGRSAAAADIAEKLDAMADDEAQRPNRDDRSYVIEGWLREAAGIAALIDEGTDHAG